MKPTVEQQAIYDYIASITDAKGQLTRSLVVNAKAGTGKTSTICYAAQELGLFPSGTRMVAFNKAIAEELQARLDGSGCRASTFHALGMEILRERIDGVKVNTRKYRDLCVKKFKWGMQSKPYTSVVDFLHVNGIGLGRKLTASEWYTEIVDVIDEGEIELPKGMAMEEFVKRCVSLFKEGLKNIKEVSFGEMLYLPLYLKHKYKWNLTLAPLLIIDEAQDVSAIRLELAKAVAPRHIAVGDDWQAIYAFAGATSGALNVIRVDTNAHVLPLSVSFRCGKSIIAEAVRVKGRGIFALEDAMEGEVISSMMDSNVGWTGMGSDDAVLCRTNAPLFSLALKLLKSDTRFFFNSDFPKQLIGMCGKLAGKSEGLGTFKTALREWLEDQREQFAMDKPGLFSRLKDKHDCLRVLAEADDVSTVSDVKLRLEDLMDSCNGVTLCTIHKSKGLEWDNVYLLRADLVPAPWIQDHTSEQFRQETNLDYVAVTRAKKKFVRVFEEKSLDL